MRVLLAAIVVIVAGGLSFATRDVHAVATDAGGATDQAVLATGADVDPDEDRVPVQLVVVGIVIGSVFVLGTGAYLLRRRLGLTAYTPPADSGHH